MMAVEKTLSPEDQLDLAWQLVDKYQGEQVDIQGQPYRRHLEVVSADFVEPLEKAAAVMHDLVEDTDVTLDDLREWGFDDYVVNTVDDVTRRDDEQYRTYIVRLSQNPLARLIKQADLRHNIGRLDQLAVIDGDKAASLRKRYEWAWAYLQEGNF
jgi:GTP diphosphokinase / guanosine-3',5'-bis(diphosphate) 3'-diphosphatase